MSCFVNRGEAIEADVLQNTQTVQRITAFSVSVVTVPDLSVDDSLSEVCRQTHDNKPK